MILQLGHSGLELDRFCCFTQLLFFLIEIMEGCFLLQGEKFDTLLFLCFCISIEAESCQFLLSMKALRIFVGLRKKVSSRICNYSTLDSGPSRKWSYFPEVKEKESSVFKHALMFQRPSIIDYNEKLSNSVSLIGTVQRPLKRVNSIVGNLGVYTFLKFKNSSRSSHYSLYVSFFYLYVLSNILNC